MKGSSGAKRDWIIHVEREVLWNTKLSAGARLTYAILRGYQGKHCKEPFPSIGTLQSKVGAWNAIYGYLNELYDAGLLRRIKERRGGRICGNKYEFLGPSPSVENREVVSMKSENAKNSAQPPNAQACYTDSTTSRIHQGGENNMWQTASVRIPITKDSHKTKEREKGVIFSSLQEAVNFFLPLFPDIPVKRSLSRLLEKKGRGCLNESYIRNIWFKREEEMIPPPKSSTTTKKDPVGWQEWRNANIHTQTKAFPSKK